MIKTPEPGSIRQLLEQATRLLHSDSARLDAEVLLASVLDKPRSHLHAWPEQVPPPAARAQFDELLQRRVAGEPVAYLTGVREFWSLPLRWRSADGGCSCATPPSICWMPSKRAGNSCLKAPKVPCSTWTTGPTPT